MGVIRSVMHSFWLSMLYYHSSSKTVQWNLWAYVDSVAHDSGSRVLQVCIRMAKKGLKILTEYIIHRKPTLVIDIKWKWLFQFHRDWFFMFVVVVTKGTKTFLSKLTTMGDVWIVTVSQGLEWIKNPTTLDKIEDFKPWKCDTPAPPPCPASQCKECYYADRQRLMSTCAPACPPHYPWVGNPDGN